MDVRTRQNGRRSLDRLVAQRLLYRRVKSVESARQVSMLVVAVVLLWGLAAGGGPLGHAAVVIVVLLWFIDQAILVPFAGRMKEEAAAFQEDFDCFVLDLPWPEYAGFERPTQDRVNELAKKGNAIVAVREGLHDWYGGDDIPADAMAARLSCQRINSRWDSRLRKEWLVFLCCVCAVAITLGLGVGLLDGISLLDVILTVAAGLRLLAWLWMEIRAQLIAKKRMENLHRYLSRAGTRVGSMSLCDVRLVQTALFEHRRTCPTVPDWFYRSRLKAHEAIEWG